MHCPVGEHTCLTAGERSEPAVVDYKRMNVSVPVGGPTALGYTINYNLSCCIPLSSQSRQQPLVVVGPPTGTETFIRLYSTTAGSLRSPAVRQVCPPTGAMHA